MRWQHIHIHNRADDKRKREESCKSMLEEKLKEKERKFSEKARILDEKRASYEVSLLGLKNEQPDL